MLSPREKRLLLALLERDKAYIKDLRQLIGAQNPAQIKLQLKKKGVCIYTGFDKVFDRDGKPCPAGYYWVDDYEKQRITEYLKKNNEVEYNSASSLHKKSRFKTIQFLQNHNSIGGNK